MDRLLCQLGPTQLASTALKFSGGGRGGAPAVSESWELQVWAAVSLTCLVEVRLRPPGRAIPAPGWLLEEPAVPATR